MSDPTIDGGRDPRAGGPNPAAEASAPQPPPCPITGRPPARLIQNVSVALLDALWRYGGRVDARRLLPRSGRVRMWESPIGLAYFDPMVAGDDAFYRTFYGNTRMHDRLAGPGVVRQEFVHAARHVPAGGRVLDVGCGEGGFRHHVPGASYTGLDPHFAAADPSGAILAETVEAHAARVGPAYDAVCAFQVLEHTADPLGFARALARCLKPGGTLLIGVPSWPSPVTGLPNFVLNAPPHHLTWWSADALVALAAELGLTGAAVEAVPMSGIEAIAYWMVRVCPVRATGPYFRLRWTWLAALAWSYAAGRLLSRILPLPPDPGSNVALLVARNGA